MLLEVMPAIGRSAVCYLTSENFPWDEGKPASGRRSISAKSRRSICHTPMEMPPFTRARYCGGYWERLPSTTEGTTIRIYVAKVESRHCFSLYKQNWEYSLLGKERGF